MPRMRILEHIEELRQRLKWSFVTVFILFAFYAFFAARVATIGGAAVPYPWPDPIRPFASQFFNATVTFLKPAYVQVAVFAPADAFVVQIKVAFFLAILTGMPMIAYQFGSFISPGLHPSERRAILRLVIPSVVLFLLGVLLAFFVVLPFTFDFLYQIAVGLGATPFLHVEAFIDFMMLFLLGFGLAFQLPVGMYALTNVGLVRAGTWRRHWRFAAIGIFLFGALITPDGTGVTMLFVSLPMLGLYVGGWVAAVLTERRKHRREGS